MLVLHKLATPLLGLLVSISLFALSIQTALADPRDFTLFNESDVTLTHIYVSPSDMSDWQEDVMGLDVLPPGDSVDIVFPSGSFSAGDCVYDIKVLARDGREGYLYKVDLCSTSTVRFS